MVMGPLYMLLGWVTVVIFLLLLGTATDTLTPDELLTSGVRWGDVFAPLWLRDIAGIAFSAHLIRYRSVGIRARTTAIESLLNVLLSIAFKVCLLLRLASQSGSFRVVCIPIYVSMLVSVIARALKSAATPPDQRTANNAGLGVGVSHLLAITVACKLDRVASYEESSWMATLWPLWLGMGALGMAVVMLACCFTPFLVCFSAAERRGPTERVLGPIMVVVTVFAVVGWACALVGCLHVALWLDGDPSAMSTGASLYLLSAAATSALLIGVCLAVIVVVQYQHAQEGDSLADEPAVSLEEMMSRAVKPKRLIKQSSTLYRRQESLLEHSPAGASDAPAQADELGVEAGGASADGELLGAGGGAGKAEAHILAAYQKEQDGEPADGAGADSDVCWICEGGPREAVFLECGHGGVCYPCAEKCWSTQRRHGCPMCRQPVTQVVRVAADAKATKDGQLVVDVLS